MARFFWREEDDIFEVYTDNVTSALRSLFNLGVILVPLSALFWVLVLTIGPIDQRPEQIMFATKITVIAVLLLASRLLYRVRWEKKVRPKVRALLEGDRVEGTIESIEETNERSGSPVLNMRITYRYTIDGREVHRTSITVAPVRLRNRVVGGPIPVYVSRSDPDHGEVDFFQIRERVDPRVTSMADG